MALNDETPCRLVGHAKAMSLAQGLKQIYTPPWPLQVYSVRWIGPSKISSSDMKCADLIRIEYSDISQHGACRMGFVRGHRQRRHHQAITASASLTSYTYMYSCFTEAFAFRRQESTRA